MENVRYGNDPSKGLVGFSVGDVAYAIPVSHVREVVNPLPTSALPHAPPAVVGVSDIRGVVVPVIDLRIRFGEARRERTRKTKWIVVDVGRLVALVVDAVTGVFGAPAPRAAPDLGGGEEARGIVGVVTREGKLVFVLDHVAFRELVHSPAAPALSGAGSAPLSMKWKAEEPS